MTNYNSGIYIIIYTSPITNKKKYYVGSSCKLKNRWKAHKRKFLAKEHRNTHMQNIVNKYSIDCLKFLPIEECYGKNDLFIREQY